MALVSKTLTEFLDLRGEAVAKEDATAEEEKQWRTFPPAERNVEVKQSLTGDLKICA